MNTDRVKTQIRNALEDARVAVQDMTGDGDHFRVIVISDAFEGLPMVQQHKLVYDALGDSMDEDIHALGLKTYTPEEWDEVSRTQSS